MSLTPAPNIGGPDKVGDYEKACGPWSPGADPLTVLDSIRRLDPTAPVTPEDVEEFLSRKVSA